MEERKIVVVGIVCLLSVLHGVQAISYLHDGRIFWAGMYLLLILGWVWFLRRTLREFEKDNEGPCRKAETGNARRKRRRRAVCHADS